jgi:hypothetical protein
VIVNDDSPAAAIAHLSGHCCSRGSPDRRDRCRPVARFDHGNLALWTAGLSLILPFPVYLMALAPYVLTLVACWRSGDGFWIAAGLLIVLLAGHMPEAAYHHSLLLLGVAFLGAALP